MSGPEQDGPGTIVERIAKVIEDLPALGKDQFNQQQKFKFRGIDDIMAALKPLLAKHQVVIVPWVVERRDAERDTKSGGKLYVVLLHVQFTFHAPDGSFLTASGWGEGTDTGDKATNKAMTGAFKYVLGQVFALADSDTIDADGTAPEAAPSKHDTLSTEQVAELVGAAKDAGVPLEKILEGYGVADVKQFKVVWLPQALGRLAEYKAKPDQGTLVKEGW